MSEHESGIKHTGVFLPDDKFAEVERLLKPTITMNLQTHITITEPGDKKGAWKLIDDFAVAKGLPRLPDGQHYGLTSDRELVSA